MKAHRVSRKKKPAEDSPEYWEEILNNEGLSMDAGLSPIIRYSGSPQELDVIDSLQVGDSPTCGDGRRIRPTGAKPE
jgi:hypothetical protein